MWRIIINMNFGDMTLDEMKLGEMQSPRNETLPLLCQYY